MNFLEKRVLEEGIVINEEILKVDKFINHQVDPKLMKEIGKEFYNFFSKNDIQCNKYAIIAQLVEQQIRNL